MSLTDKNGQPIYWDGRALKLAYTKLLEQTQGQQQAAPAQPAACTFCDEEGLCEIWVPAAGLNVKAPCRDCRPKAFDQYMADWHKKHGAKQEPVSLSLVQRTADKLTLVCTQCGEKVVEQYPRERPHNVWLNMAEGSEKPPELCKGTLKLRAREAAEQSVATAEATRGEVADAPRPNTD